MSSSNPYRLIKILVLLSERKTLRKVYSKKQESHCDSILHNYPKQFVLHITIINHAFVFGKQKIAASFLLKCYFRIGITLTSTVLYYTYVAYHILLQDSVKMLLWDRRWTNCKIILPWPIFSTPTDSPRNFDLVQIWALNEIFLVKLSA